jgi:hypothetical protein
MVPMTLKYLIMSRAPVVSNTPTTNTDARGHNAQAGYRGWPVEDGFKYCRLPQAASVGLCENADLND